MRRLLLILIIFLAGTHMVLAWATMVYGVAFTTKWPQSKRSSLVARQTQSRHTPGDLIATVNGVANT